MPRDYNLLSIFGCGKGKSFEPIACQDKVCGINVFNGIHASAFTHPHPSIKHMPLPLC